MQRGDIYQSDYYDPGAGKTPSPYNEFMRDEMARLKTQGVGHKEAFKEATANWRDYINPIFTVLNTDGNIAEIMFNKRTYTVAGNFQAGDIIRVTINPSGQLEYNGVQFTKNLMKVGRSNDIPIPVESVRELPNPGQTFIFGYNLNGQAPQVSLRAIVQQFIPQENMWLVSINGKPAKFGLSVQNGHYVPVIIPPIPGLVQTTGIYSV